MMGPLRNLMSALVLLAAPAAFACPPKAPALHVEQGSKMHLIQSKPEDQLTREERRKLAEFEKDSKKADEAAMIVNGADCPVFDDEGKELPTPAPNRDSEAAAAKARKTKDELTAKWAPMITEVQPAEQKGQQ